MINPCLLFHTLRFLKPIQVVGRLWWHIKRRCLKIPRIQQTSLAARRLMNAEFSGLPKEVSFSFNNTTAVYPTSTISWIDLSKEKLWRYKLNSFDFISLEPFRRNDSLVAFLLLSWIADNDDQTSETWEPYPISKRLPKWLDWLENVQVDQNVSRLVVASIIQQLFRLYYDIEWHIQANHLFENLKTIFVASSKLLKFSETPNFFKPRIRRLLLHSTRLLAKELPAQLFEDGGHFERSPMYHFEVMKGLKEIIVQIEKSDTSFLNAAELERLAHTCKNSLEKMVWWDSALRHPDGGFAQFGDTSLEDELNPLLILVNDPEITLGKLLPSSGFFVKRWGEGNYLAVNLGDPSPPFQPGHSHCDSLSYELSVNGRRLITDTGCGSYQNPEIRWACRRTSAHNVPWLKPHEYSEIWGSFRMGRRSKILRRELSPARDVLTADLQDYSGNVFRRRIYLAADSIRISDTVIQQACDGEFESLVHFSPEVQVRLLDDTNFEIFAGCRRFRLTSNVPGHPEPGSQYPRFGEARRNVLIKFSTSSRNSIDYALFFGCK